MFAAAGLVRAAPAAWRTECVGYYTMQLPGDIEYAVQQPPLERGWNPKFADGLGVWGTSFSVGTDQQADKLTRVSISSEATQQELDALTSIRNRNLQRFKDEELRKAEAVEKLGYGHDAKLEHLKTAEDVLFFKSFDNGTVSARYDDQGVTFDALTGTRIVSAGLKLTGTPQQTIDAFLKRYRARAPFDVPTEPGVCFPYSFVTGEKEPASVGISMRLRDRPDIVIYLHDGKDFTTLHPPPDAMSFMQREIRFGAFYGNKVTAPLDGTSNQYHSITVDGRKGVGTFALVTRNNKPGPEAINNAANNDQDWAYLAYVAADSAAPSGMSSDLVFKVERFGRFAKESMTEKDFRELVKALAASIKRRPGAWLQR